FVFLLFCFCFFFFFSSRRRHTRFSRDWSSDVCSSDLKRYYKKLSVDILLERRIEFFSRCIFLKKSLFEFGSNILIHKSRTPKNRSEERRVGKECRSRWSTDH